LTRAVVLDASIALAWCFEEPGTEDAVALIKTPGLLFVAPAIWPLEVANALLVSLRKGRIDGSRLNELIPLLAKLPIRLEAPPSMEACREIVGLAQSFNLTVYDAAYLALAMDEKLPLATLDAALVRAAEKTGTAWP